MGSRPGKGEVKVNTCWADPLNGKPLPLTNTFKSYSMKTSFNFELSLKRKSFAFVTGKIILKIMSSKGKIEGRRRRGRARGWDGWMTSPMQWTWTWANFRRWWETGRPSVLQSMGLLRVWHDWVTEQQQQGKHMVKNSQRILGPSEFIAGLQIWDHFSQIVLYFYTFVSSIH